MNKNNQSVSVSRRAVLENGVLFLAAPLATPPLMSLANVNNGTALNSVNGVDSLESQSTSRETRSADEAPQTIRVGLVTDLHHADKDPAGSRHYRETRQKLEEAGRQFQADTVDFVVELGDLIDAADSVETELRYLKTINQQLEKISSDRHYVLGNHCVDTLTAEEFLGGVEREKSYYSFDRGNLHFIVLNSCFRGDYEPYGRRNFQWTDANIPPEELEWLKADLAAAKRPTIVFAHQRLDVSDAHGVRNAETVRQILHSAGSVLAVLQGHSHQNDLKEIDGIHYCTLAAMVEGSGPEQNGYAVMHISPDGSIALNGFRRQVSRVWGRKKGQVSIP